MEYKPVSIADIIEEFRKELNHRYGEDEVSQFLYLLFSAWMGLTKLQIHLEKSRKLLNAEATRFTNALQELKKNKPIQYILGETSFHGLHLKVTPEVLIPRPETEELVSVAEQDIRGKNRVDISVMDICTGSGCIAISLKKMFSYAKVTAIDISEGALKVAKENAIINNCEIQFYKTDILEKSGWKEFANYHVIIANPPYVTEKEKSRMEKNVLDYEPSLALFVPDENPFLFYQAIADFSMIHLHDDGVLYLEINENYSGEISELLHSKGFRRIEILRDLHEKPRFVRVVR